MRLYLVRSVRSLHWNGRTYNAYANRYHHKGDDEIADQDSDDPDDDRGQHSGVTARAVLIEECAQ